MRVIVADSALNPGEPAYASSFVITSVPVSSAAAASASASPPEMATAENLPSASPP